jgi:hypothetical protein
MQLAGDGMDLLDRPLVTAVAGDLQRRGYLRPPDLQGCIGATGSSFDALNAICFECSMFFSEMPENTTTPRAYFTSCLLQFAE